MLTSPMFLSEMSEWKIKKDNKLVVTPERKTTGTLDAYFKPQTSMSSDLHKRSSVFAKCIVFDDDSDSEILEI